MAFGYDPNKASQVSDNDVLPAGEYAAIISEVEDKETKDGRGNYLRLSLTIADGRYRNWKVQDLINYRNANEKAVEIAYRTLKRISMCLFGRDDKHFESHDLVGKRIRITTKVEDNGQYQNARVKSYVLPSKDDGVKVPSPGTGQRIEERTSHVSRPVPPPSEDDDVPFN